MFRISAKIALLGIAIAVTASLGSLQLYGQSQGELARNVPLTYTMLVWDATSLAKDSTEGTEIVRRGARRGDGSTVISSVHTDPDGTRNDSRIIADLEGGRSVIVDTNIRSVTTTVLNERTVRSRRDRRPACRGRVVGTYLGHDVVAGESRPPVEIPVVAKYGEMREENLMAPDLACLLMESRLIMTYPDGSERVVRLSRVVDVTLGEPDPNLFVIPADYVEMSPMERASARRGGVNLTSDVVFQQLEQTYQAQRVR